MSTKDWIEKDYYKTLGVKKDASQDQIKKAFRKLARENHPDQNADPKAEERFKEITEAHDVLGDPAKRKEYDEARSLFGAGGGFRFPGAGGMGGAAGGRASGINLDDLFGDVGGIGDIFGNLFNTPGGAAPRTSTAGAGRGPRRGADVEGEVTVSFLNSVEGATVEVRMAGDTACDNCHGTGAEPGTAPRVCPTCQGSGMMSRQSGGFAFSEPCSDCRGRGLIIDHPCKVCNGTGRKPSSKAMQVRVPAGVTDGQRIRVKGKGGPGANGGAAGDLYVVVHVKPHTLYGRKGDNLTISVPVTYAEAALGSTIEVPLLGGGSVSLKVPAGTPSGRTFRVKGKGIALKAGRSDLLVTIDVQVPKTLSAEAKEALSAYQSLAHEGDPRSELARLAA
ncbi:MAG: molecular chaperone DnaJ [Propionibacteriaceae bacterium]|jgi:molecular chaperone DnaJ|nr:molecular chaperone DnaJ [Propionibacteriaceae bacterium]